MNIGKRIKEARLAKEMTQDELAALVGIASSYVSRLERGDRDPSWSLAVRLAKALDVELAFSAQADERRARAWRMFEAAFASPVADRYDTDTDLMKAILAAIDQGQAVLDREPSP